MAAADDLYRMASEQVRLLNAAIDEATDPEREAHLRKALEHAHDFEDQIARVLELRARKEGA